MYMCALARTGCWFNDRSNRGVTTASGEHYDTLVGHHTFGAEEADPTCT